MNYIESENRKVFYRVSGENNSRTIIFVHGLAGDSRFFHNQLKFFSHDFRVIAIDLPGHGRSHKLNETSAELYSRSIEQVVRRENIRSYILAGHSMGGAVCLEHYRKNRKSIEALILVSTSSRIPVTQEMVDSSMNDFQKFFDTMLTSIFYKKAGIFIIAARKTIDDNEKSIITEDLKICMTMDYSDMLGEIEVPVLLLANRYDSMIPSEMTSDMYNNIKNAKLIVFDKYGHVPFFEESETFNSAVSDFITSIQ